jgi:hypothetical protein
VATCVLAALLCVGVGVTRGVDGCDDERCGVAGAAEVDGAAGVDATGGDEAVG